MEFRDYLDKARKDIEDQMQLFLNQWLDDVKVLSPRLTPLHEEFVGSCQGGKRLRGFLVKLGYEIASGKLNKEILKVAAALEIFQTAILAHDDIIDQSPTRRGRPTIYKKLGGDHYGISQTICLGDIGFFLSLRLINAANFPNNLKNQATKAFTDMFIYTASGEMLDIEAGSLAEKEIFKIYQLKTAYYAFVYPLIIGATLGNAKPELIKTLSDFGENLGIAYQIKDDILGVFGDEEALGKSVKSDVEEGKKTILISEALKTANSQQKKVLTSLYGKSDLSDENLGQIKTIFVETESLSRVENKVIEYTDNARAILENMTIKKEYKKILEDFMDYLTNRIK